MEDEHKRVEFQYGIILIRTNRFQSLMDRLGKYRISRPTAWFFLYLMPIGAGIALFLFLTLFQRYFVIGCPSCISYIRTISPLANLGLPGINPYIPIVDGWIALVVAMVVHEGAHGVIARSLGLPVKSAGLLLFLFVPIGAFVEVDESALKAARARDSGRVLAAGAGANMVLAIASLLLMFAVVSAMTPVSSGVSVVQVVSPSAGAQSPAASAGIQAGDVITAVNGVQVTDIGTFSTIAGQAVPHLNTTFSPGETIGVSILRDGQTFEKTVTLGSVTYEDLQTHANYTYAYLGASLINSKGLQELAGTYSSSALSDPALYVCIPTLPNCQGLVPFSDLLGKFYTSPLGPLTSALPNLLYWFFFLNFNLAIFNSLPIYPLDGGQAFRAGVKGLGGGKLSEKTIGGITTGTSLAVVALLLVVIVGPYLV
jgi:membrane-associated protease RseP (regulator of RpoE activity)